jgi:hypothetical protein
LIEARSGVHHLLGNASTGFMMRFDQCYLLRRSAAALPGEVRRHEHEHQYGCTRDHQARCDTQ